MRIVRCGVQGYVRKDRPAAELPEATRPVFPGREYLPAGMSDSLIVPEPKSAAKEPGAAALTDRAREVPALPSTPSSAGLPP